MLYNSISYSGLLMSWESPFQGHDLWSMPLRSDAFCRTAVSMFYYADQVTDDKNSVASSAFVNVIWQVENRQRSSHSWGDLFWKIRSWCVPLLLGFHWLTACLVSAKSRSKLGFHPQLELASSLKLMQICPLFIIIGRCYLWEPYQVQRY